MALADISYNTFQKYMKLRIAFDKVVAGRVLNARPPRKTHSFTNKTSYLTRLIRYNKQVCTGEARMPLNDGGEPDRQVIADLAGLPAGWSKNPKVVDAINLLVKEHSADASSGQVEQGGMELLDAYDLKLAANRGRVPSLSASPPQALRPPRSDYPIARSYPPRF